MIKRIFNRIESLDAHTKDVLKKSGWATVVKLIGVLMGLLLSIFLGRSLGASGLGIIDLSNRIVAILLIFSLLGLPQLLIKKIAIAHQRKDLRLIGSYMNSAFKLNGIVTIILTIGLIIISPYLSTNVFKEPGLVLPLIIAGSVMIFQVFSRIYSSGLIGFQKIWQSNLVNQTLSVVITTFILIILWVLNIKISIINTAVAYATGRIFVTLSIAIYWKKLYLFDYRSNRLTLRMFVAGLPFLLISAKGLIAANIDGVMVGWIGTARDVGLYSVASKLALLSIFFFCKLPTPLYHRSWHPYFLKIKFSR